MILTIIFGALFLVGLVLYIIGRAYYLDLTSNLDSMGAFCAILASIGLVICLGFIIAAQYNNVIYGDCFGNKVNELNAEYKSLEQMNEYCNNKIITPTEMVGKVAAYNAKVTSFRTEVTKGKYLANNPWTSWLNPSFYNSFTGDEVQFYSFVSPES